MEAHHGRTLRSQPRCNTAPWGELGYCSLAHSLPASFPLTGHCGARCDLWTGSGSCCCIQRHVKYCGMRFDGTLSFFFLLLLLLLLLVDKHLSNKAFALSRLRCRNWIKLVIWISGSVSSVTQNVIFFSLHHSWQMPHFQIISGLSHFTSAVKWHRRKATRMQISEQTCKLISDVF